MINAKAFKTAAHPWLRHIAVIVGGAALLLTGCGNHPLVIDISGGGSDPGRMYNATRAVDTTLNLADAADAGCTGARAAQGDAAAAQARAAAANLQGEMAAFNDTAEAEARMSAAMKAAADAGRAAFYMAISCGAVPPDVPNIPVYSEEFWDVASP